MQSTVCRCYLAFFLLPCGSWGSGKWHKNMLILWPVLLMWVLIKFFASDPGVSIFLPESMKLWQANMLASSKVISQVFDSFSDKDQVVIETCLSGRERTRGFHFKSTLGSGDAITSYNIYSTIQITSKFLPQLHPQKHPLCSQSKYCSSERCPGCC